MAQAWTPAMPTNRPTIVHAWYGLSDKTLGVDVTGIVQKQVRKGTCGEEVHINVRCEKYALNELFLCNTFGDPARRIMKAVVEEYHYDHDRLVKLVTPRLTHVIAWQYDSTCCRRI